MFGFRRKSDGFEWREYVRTTVLVRRKQRRDRVVGARDAAVEGALNASSAGARGLVQIMKTAGSALASAPRRASKSIESGLLPLLRRLRPTIARLRPALAPVTLLMAAAGVVYALHAGMGKSQAVFFNTPVSARTALVMLAAAAVIALAGFLYQRYGIEHLSIPARLQATRRRLSALTRRVSTPVRRGAVAAVIAMTVIWVSWSAWRGTTPTAAIASLGSPLFSAPPIEGRASAVSGNVLKVNGQEVRLAGIDAPDKEQRCIGISGSKWRCGDTATEALSKAVRNRKIVCQTSGTDEAGRRLATCLSGTEDIGARLVREGAVFAAGGMFASYAADERDAKSRKVGVWRAATVERPTEWRAKIWETARKAAPDGCPIKGQVSSSGKKTYLAPWSADYDGAKVRTSRGERWFCSDAEAVSAGFKPAERG